MRPSFIIKFVSYVEKLVVIHGLVHGYRIIVRRSALSQCYDYWRIIRVVLNNQTSIRRPNISDSTLSKYVTRMPGEVLKKVYMAKSAEELNEKLQANLDMLEPYRNNVKFLVDHAPKAYHKANLKRRDGDEECAYILFMRYFEVVRLIKKSPEYKKDKVFYDKLMNLGHLKIAADLADELMESLQIRYRHLAEEEEEERKKQKELLDQNENKVKEPVGNGTSDVIANGITNGPNSNGSLPSTKSLNLDQFRDITCQQLYRLLFSQAMSDAVRPKVLVIDIRPRADFEESRIRNDVCLSIPDELLRRGITAAVIDNQLPDASRPLWNSRGVADYVVFVDWFSCADGLADKSKIYSQVISIKEALYQWDASTNKVRKSPAYVLQGGYRDWLMSYPQTCINPTVTPPEKPLPVEITNSVINGLNSFEYPNLDFMASPMEVNNSRTTMPPSFDRAAKPPERLSHSATVIRKGSSDSNGGVNGLAEDDTTPMTALYIVKRASQPPDSSPRMGRSSVSPKIPHTNMSSESGSMFLSNGFTAPSSAPQSVPLPSVNRGLKPDVTKSDVKHPSANHSSRLETNNISSKEKENSHGLTNGLTDDGRRTQRQTDTDLDLTQQVDEVYNDVKERLASALQRVKLTETEASEPHEMTKDELEQERRRESIKSQLIRLKDLINANMGQRDSVDELKMLRMQLEDALKSTYVPDLNILEDAVGRYAPRDTQSDRPKQKKVVNGGLNFNEGGSGCSPNTTLSSASPDNKKKVVFLDASHGGDTYTQPIRDAPSAQPPSILHNAGQVLSPSTNNNHINGVNLAPAQRSGSSIGSALNRCHSSPDVSQVFEAGDGGSGSAANLADVFRPGSSGAGLPTFDRTAKPNMLTRFNMLDVNAARIRNLNPVYGSQHGNGVPGLKNLGNTCFMNSIIQCLAATLQFAYYFLSDHYQQDLNKENPLGTRGQLANEFAVVIKALYSGSYKFISPSDFKRVVGRYQPLFEGNEQHDSQEFLCFLMDGLHEDLNRFKGQRPRLPEQDNTGVADDIAAKRAWDQHTRLNQSVVVDLFQGQFKSTVRCRKCGKESITFDSFMYLSLPIPPGASSCTIKDCWQLFCKEELMTGSSKWHCPACNQPREATKKLDIWRLPPVLLIHLKRFFYEGMWRKKLQTQVDFPVSDADFTSRSPSAHSKSYNLYAVTNHYGTMEGGHYTAYCRNKEFKSKWLRCDDHEVHDLPTSSIKSSAAYILFYTSLD